MALAVAANRYRCTECNRVEVAYEPTVCCGFTMLIELNPDKK